MDRLDRNNRFDNLKGVLIFLVVLGHALPRLQNVSMQVSSCLYSLIFSFHMPAFIFISGYFSKNSMINEEYSRELIKNLLVPYVLVGLLMWLYTSRSIETIFYPRWTLWYLLSLFFWRLLVVPFSKIRFSVAVALFLSVTIGFSPATQLLSVSRTVAFFPVFLLGYKVSEDRIERILKINKGLLATLLLAIFSLVIFMYTKRLPLNDIFRMDIPYKDISGITEVQAALLRFFALLIGSVSSFCLLGLTTEKKSCITILGRNTMPVYLGHTFALAIMNRVVSVMSPSFLSNEVWVIVSAIGVSALICLIFGNPFVAKIYHKALDWVSKAVLLPGWKNREG